MYLYLSVPASAHTGTGIGTGRKEGQRNRSLSYNKYGRSVKAIHSFLSNILPPTGTQNALGESHKKASTQQAARRTGVLA